MRSVQRYCLSTHGAGCRRWRRGCRTARRRVVVAALACLVLGLARDRAATAAAPTTGSLLVVSASERAAADLGPLIELRRSQGWQVRFCLAEGSSSSRTAALVAQERKRNPALSHVLLVGSVASVPMASRPNYRVQSSDVKRDVLTDDVYGLPDEKGVPRLAVGRLPADEGRTLQRLAAKVLQYENDVEQLAPELFLLSGRQPASTQPLFARVSPQAALDAMSKASIESARLRLPRLRIRARTAFPGPDYYSFADAPGVLREGLARRPLLATYVGHGQRTAFQTCHDTEHVEGITREHVRAFPIPTVCGPFISGGCSMLDPEGNGLSIGETILRLHGGPVAVVGFTRANNDFWVAQFFEVTGDELSKARRTTLGEFVRTIKQRMANEPQSPSSLLIQALLQAAGEIRRDPMRIDYSAVVRKNNAILALFGDPATTIVIP